MARLLLQIDSVGVAIDLQEQLEAAGHEVDWDAEATVAPEASDHDVVILPADRATAERIDRWRDRDPAPGFVVIGPEVPGLAALRVERVTHIADEQTVPDAIARAIANRFVARISAPFARAALGLPQADAAAVVRAARAAPAALVRDALKPHANSYVAATAAIDQLREARALEIPEVELLRKCDGTRTLTTVSLRGGLKPMETGRLIWSLASVGAVTLTAEPPDVSTPARRRLAETRRHLEARLRRVRRASPYDVLEVHRDTYVEEIDLACKMLGTIVAPKKVSDLDLADLFEVPAQLWEQILEARSVLYYEHTHAAVDGVIDKRPDTYDPCVFGRADLDHREAMKVFKQGQDALSAGEVFKAVSLMARAARLHPDHPVIESYLHWAKFRADVERGGDKAEAAARERAAVETFIYGRRPWPRARVALALLCAAGGDAESARWHVGIAARLDPELASARRLLARLDRG